MSPVSMAALVPNTNNISQGWESDYTGHQTARIKTCSTLTSSHDGPANADMACMHVRSHEVSLGL